MSAPTTTTAEAMRAEATTLEELALSLLWEEPSNPQGAKLYRTVELLRAGADRLESSNATH